MGGDAHSPVYRVDQKARPGNCGAEPAVVAVVAVSEAKRAVFAQGVVSQDFAVELIAVAVVEGSAVEVAPVKGSGVVSYSFEIVGIPGVISVPAFLVIEGSPGVVS